MTPRRQPWEDVASDVSAAIEKALTPLLRKTADDIYSSLLDTTQDYLADNIAFNIASRIDTAEREAASDRQALRDIREVAGNLVRALIGLKPILDRAESNASGNMEWDDVSARINAARAALARAGAGS